MYDDLHGTIFYILIYSKSLKATDFGRQRRSVPSFSFFQQSNTNSIAYNVEIKTNTNVQ